MPGRDVFQIEIRKQAHPGLIECLSDQFAARKLLGLRHVQFQPLENASERDRRDAPKRIAIPQLRSHPVESDSSTTFGRWNNNEFMPAPARAQIAANHTMNARFDDGMIARINPDVIILRTGKPGDQVVHAPRPVE